MTKTNETKTNDTSKFDHVKLENRVLADSELDAVSGGMRDRLISSMNGHSIKFTNG